MDGSQREGLKKSFAPYTPRINSRSNSSGFAFQRESLPRTPRAASPTHQPFCQRSHHTRTRQVLRFHGSLTTSEHAPLHLVGGPTQSYRRLRRLILSFRLNRSRRTGGRRTLHVDVPSKISTLSNRHSR